MKDNAADGTLVIKPLCFEDASVVQILCINELGYPIEDGEQFSEYFENLLKDPAIQFLGAYLNGKCVGFIQLMEYKAVYQKPQIEIVALAVGQQFHGYGIGKSLLRAAEKLAFQKGFASIRVTSNMKRKGAHVFYEKCGYRKVKESGIFQIDFEL